MGRLASSGKVGFISFVIWPTDDKYNAVILAPDETISLTFDNWNSAERIVKKTIKRIEETENENERNLSREED